MKKKNISQKDLNTWRQFIKNLPKINSKEEILKNSFINAKKILDLHGFSLDEANNAVYSTIVNCFLKKIKILKIITGKGLRSKSFDDPYKSKDLSILKNSIPQYILSSELKKYIHKIIKAPPSDGGEGAFYVFLKINKSKE